ncbi:exonuclease domain-containing protein [Bradyrhizobium sp. Leo170]|uniref:exonuclease domain-containing protein n=1 Tax=Bradyrhizobium sp. Leo170 TaxID=1571199 RepID=UPI0013EE46B6|nr:exonuclease domain-containing protein [Bradyrhizobium sp. Leo170]
MIIRVCDLETTGLDASDEVIEIGYTDIVKVSGVWSMSSRSEQSFARPARPIPPEASAVHHITDEDVKDAPAWSDAWRLLVQTPDDGGKITFAAHMAQYERQYLDPLFQADWVCTWKCSFRQWPDFESHSLQVLRYALKLPADPKRAAPAHRAPPDSYVCGLLLLELLQHQTLETLIEWSAQPPIFTKFDFGQFKGKPLSAADAGYLDWLGNKDHNLGEDWRWNARREIERRANAKVEEAARARRGYLEQSLAAIPGAVSVRDLENWWHGQSDHWAAHGILVDSKEYEMLRKACADRKQHLLRTGEPQFEPPGAST